MKKEEEILKTCLQFLADNPLVEKCQFADRKSEIVEKSVDGELLIKLKNGEQVNLALEIKGILKRPLPEHLRILMQENAGKMIVFSEFVNSSIGHDLRRSGINYVDMQGNAYVHIPGSILIDVQGKPRKRTIEMRQTALFQPKGMQLIFVLLKNAESVNYTIRKLQKLAGISYERTATAIQELKSKGYLQPSGKKTFRLIRKRELFEKWIANYGDRLRPNIFMGGYKASPDGLHQLSGLLRTYLQSERYYAIGGPSATELLTNYNRAVVKDLYIDPGEFYKISQKIGIVPARDANIHVFSLFSSEVISEIIIEGFRIVHPLLTYAETLYNTGDREREAAQIVYDQYLRDLIQ